MKPIPICRVLAALLLLPLFACGPDGVVPRRTVIAGRVVDLAGGASGAVLFNTEDPFALKSRMAARVSPEANDFHFVFRTAYTTGMTGVYGDFFDLIVSPGDSVYVTIDAGRMRAGDPDAIRFSGDHARTNNALASVAGLKRRLCEQAPAVEGDPQEYLASYRRYRQAVADSLSARRLPAEVREAVARDIDMVQIWNHDLDPAAWRAIFTDPMFDIFDLERNMVSVINYSAGISYYLGAICPDEIEAVRSGAAPAEALRPLRPGSMPTRRSAGDCAITCFTVVWKACVRTVRCRPNGWPDCSSIRPMRRGCANGRRNVLLSALSRFPACCGAMRRDGSIRCPTASCSRRWRPVIRGRRSTSISVRHGAVLAAAS